MTEPLRSLSGGGKTAFVSRAEGSNRRLARRVFGRLYVKLVPRFDVGRGPVVLSLKNGHRHAVAMIVRFKGSGTIGQVDRATGAEQRAESAGIRPLGLTSPPRGLRVRFDVGQRGFSVRLTN